jgi:hypothetical protein
VINGKATMVGGRSEPDLHWLAVNGFQLRNQKPEVTTGEIAGDTPAATADCNGMSKLAARPKRSKFIFQSKGGSKCLNKNPTKSLATVSRSC